MSIFKRLFGRTEPGPPAPPLKPAPPAASETSTVTRIRGIEFDETLITAAAPRAASLPLVVLAFLDGRRVTGRLYNFTTSRETCQFLPITAKHGDPSEQIQLKQLKAIFFLREGTTPAAAKSETATATFSQPGRRLEVIFADNERLRGTTTGYTPERLGFFLVPHDPTGKILRVYVINANSQQVKWL